jgi:hypothetical protein
MQGRILVIVLVTLIIGFGAGFVLRPVIVPVGQTVVAGHLSAAQAPAAPRGVQYFAAHIDEARQVISGCSDGSVRGDECVYADQAVIEAEARERFKKFMGN